MIITHYQSQDSLYLHVTRTHYMMRNIRKRHPLLSPSLPPPPPSVPPYLFLSPFNLPLGDMGHVQTNRAPIIKFQNSTRLTCW
jgi:hypothetical protein